MINRVTGEIDFKDGLLANKDWLVIAYNRQPRVPRPEKSVLLGLFAHEKLSDDNA